MENRHMKNVLLKPFAITTAIMGSVFIGADAIRPEFTSGNETTEETDYTQNLTVKQANKRASDTFINSLTLVNESLQSMLSLLERWTGKILIIGSNLPNATFNLNIPMPLTRDEAIAVLKSLLSANGIGVTPVNDKTLKVSPINRAKSNSPEIVSRAVKLLTRNKQQQIS